MKSSYELEVAKIVNEIKTLKAKKVLLQFPDGLKIYAGEVVDEIKRKTKINPVIFLGTCYGACDIPIGLLGNFDLVVQWGHNMFIKNINGWR